MPTLPFSPAGALNYMGFGAQSVKGTGVAAAYFAAYIEAVDLSHNQAIRRVREAGNGLYIARDVKDVHLPGFRFAAAARPDITGAILAMFLGADSISGAGDPYTHTITPVETTTWVTVERNLNDEVTERIEDAFFTEVQLDIRKRDGGPEAILIVTGGGLSPTYEASQSTDLYESDLPFLRSQMTWKLDGSAVTDVERATLTMRWIFDESILSDALTRDDAVKLAFEADLEIVELFDSTAALNAYRATHFGSSSGTAAAEAVYQPNATDSFEVSMTYGTPARTLTINIPKVSWVEAKLTEPTPNASEAVRLTRSGHLITAAVPITATVLNATTPAYV